MVDKSNKGEEFNDNINKNDSLKASESSSSFRVPPHCLRCKMHGLEIQLKGHKRYCQYIMCKCNKCEETLKRQRIMAQKIAQRRAEELDKAQGVPLKDFKPKTKPNTEIEDLKKNAENLRETFNFTYETLPFIFAIIRANKGDIAKSLAVIQEGHDLVYEKSQDNTFVDFDFEIFD
ncbi:CLUMA_CG015417, isoform A [Clunio marinus]|uniref:CLUMA_CG015417, isoform A n=1 Tax=Clunio marinus TaxID=568069 RepID=A0A1J1ISS3_9DIPT|nr:CLUMA_CG015417, isoform A [Clunio marinus]